MRIVDIETYLVGNPWKNWVFVRLMTDEGIHGIGEGSLGHLSKTVETAIHEIKPLILGLEIFQTELLVTRLQRHVYADGGQIKMCAISAIEIACWDAIGKASSNPSTILWAGGAVSVFVLTPTAGTAVIAHHQRSLPRRRPRLPWGIQL